MKVYFRFRCDYGHEWVSFRDEFDVTSHDSEVCPFGHQAVTFIKERPVEDVQITMRPAARIVDELKGQVAWKGKYYVVISESGALSELVSRNVYAWEEACLFARKFEGRNFEWIKKYFSKDFL